MKSNGTKLIAIIVALVVLLAGGNIAYRTLSAAQSSAQDSATSFADADKSVQYEDVAGSADADSSSDADAAADSTAQAGKAGANDGAAATDDVQTVEVSVEDLEEQGSVGLDQPKSDPENGIFYLKDYDPVVYTLDGTKTSFTQIANGKPLVVNFWATWCPYCIQEFPDMQEIYNEYSDRISFAFVDYTDGRRETVDIASRWIEENGYTFPVYYDTDLAAVYTYGVRSYPTTMLVEADGQISGIASGMVDPILLRQALDQMVA